MARTAFEGQGTVQPGHEECWNMATAMAAALVELSEEKSPSPAARRIGWTATRGSAKLWHGRRPCPNH
jgi:hypothetical protein